MAVTESIQSLFSLEGKVAIITGASRGIGEEIAMAYTMAGAKVVICSRKPEEIKEAAGRVSNNDQDVLGIAANISLAEDRERLVKETIEWSGRIDILVNNAAANPGFGALANVNEKTWDRIFDINLKASFLLSQMVYQSWMKGHGGSIINIASLGGLITSEGINAYGVSKAALIHLTRCQAREWGHDGVRVNGIAPGIIRTKFSQPLWDDPMGASIVEKHPIPRFGEVEDIAGTALLLASSASSYMTGQILVVDGGQTVCS